MKITDIESTPSFPENFRGSGGDGGGGGGGSGGSGGGDHIDDYYLCVIILTNSSISALGCFVANIKFIQYPVSSSKFFKSIICALD